MAVVPLPLPLAAMYLDRAHVQVEGAARFSVVFEELGRPINRVLSIEVAPLAVSLDLVAVGRGAVPLVLQADVGDQVSGVVEVIYDRSRALR
ncbi:MAG: hypothetical protein MUQ10_11615 [Anaerolineae bacterium]|nr:hypothetical protein [Anaerolineae bacterium]